MSKLAKDNSVIAAAGAQDLTNYRGFFVRFSSGATVDLIATPASQRPLGVIVDGQSTAGQNSIACCGSGHIAKVKCAASAGTINPGTLLQLDGTTLGAVSADAGSGGRVIVGKALEAGANNALIDAVLFTEYVAS